MEIITMTEVETKTKQQVSLYERAVAYVLNQPKTEKQVRQWYTRKTSDQKMINNDIARLKDYNLINDNAYAQMYVEAKKEKMGIGMIRNKLRVNGIAPEIIEEVLSVVENQHDFALNCVNKYMRTKNKTSETKSKLFRWLLGKGIAYDLCMEVVDEYWH